MPPSNDEVQPHPEEWHAFFLEQVHNLRQSLAMPPISSLSMDDLLWSMLVSYAHCLEIVLRVYGPLHPSALSTVLELAGKALVSPTPVTLHNLLLTWVRQRNELEIDGLQVPIYFLFHQLHLSQALREIARRGRDRNHPVYRAYAGLSAGPVQSDSDRIQCFLTAMDQTLQATVDRHLQRDCDDRSQTHPSAPTDVESIAIEGAIAKKTQLEEWLAEVYFPGKPILTKSGVPRDDVPKLPEIPPLAISEMQDTNGQNAIWRTTALSAAFRFLAQIVPGTLGFLETLLSDAAHAAQRVVREQADAKKRGGSGGEKAKKAGTAEPPVQHLSIDRPQANRDSGRDERCIDPDELLDEGSPSIESTIVDKDLAAHAMRIAVQRWGDSGRRMLEAFQDRCTDKEAAERAGISAPALMKRRKTLKKLLSEQ